MSNRGRLMFAVVAAVAITAHAGILWERNRPIRPPNVTALSSVSFSPNQRHADPEKGDAPTIKEIEADLALVQRISPRVRTYTTAQNLDAVPTIADRIGMSVSLGAWIDIHDPVRTEREITTAGALARAHRSVTDVIVGNESLLREDATPADLISAMRRVRAASGKPVSTAETWDTWLKHPEMAQEADFITIHVLPYWEGVPADKAVAVAVSRYNEVRRAFPGKRVVVGEFGWPSAKFNREGAIASAANQARVVREFAATAARLGIPYNMLEAFDQPWKTMEGDVGPYWGLFDASREAKFALSGPVNPDPSWIPRAVIGVSIGLLLALASGGAGGIVRTSAVQAAAQLTGWALAAAVWVPLQGYMSLGLAISWVVGLPLVLLLAITAFDRAREMVEMLLGKKPTRVLRPAAAFSADPAFAPKVSIHVPACNELPSVVIQTLESLARLDYPNFEVLAVVNNTTKPELVDPVRIACERLGERFRFVYLPSIKGFKAGALNRALDATAIDAEIIAVVDADYTVSADWLRDLVPAFRDPRIALVQAPQEHRDENLSWLKRAMNSEYAGFFDAGMVLRNEDDAIIAHGTMILLRRSAVEAVGRWDERHICEDTELGLRLFKAGWSAAYTDRRYGAGLLPDTLRAFRRQRDRWAYGGMRIMMSHVGSVMPWSRALGARQQWHFATGWLHWIGDAAAAVLAVANVGWVTWMQATGLGEPPAAVLTCATAVAAGVAIAHTVAVHATKVRRGGSASALAAWAGIGLQLTVAKAVLSSLVLSNLPFAVTAKGGRPSCGWKLFCRSSGPEIALAAGLIAGALVTVLNNTHRMLELDLFATILAIQSIPFLASFAMGAAEFGGIAWADALERRRTARPGVLSSPALAIAVLPS